MQVAAALTQPFIFYAVYDNRTVKSFVYAESGLKGFLMVSRLSGLFEPHLSLYATPGTLISSYEVYDARL